MRRVGTVASVAAVASSGLLLPAPSAAGPGPGGCGRVGRGPGSASTHELRQSVLCLVNRVRGNHGLPPLSYNEDLRRAADGHSRDMVRRRYFAHSGFGGGDLVARVSNAGYRGFYVVGENIGWGPGRTWGSPNSMVDRWMHSSGHRENILNPRYREFGAGVSRGSPIGGGQGTATYTLDFGSRD